MLFEGTEFRFTRFKFKGFFQGFGSTWVKHGPYLGIQGHHGTNGTSFGDRLSHL